MVLLQELTPLITDERSITLKGMGYFKSLVGALMNDSKCFFVVSDRQNERFSGVPDDAKAVSNEASFRNHFHCGFYGLQGHTLSVIAIRQVAIIAIDITERCRL